jgi:hypothetical protein
MRRDEIRGFDGTILWLRKILTAPVAPGRYTLAFVLRKILSEKRWRS